MKLKIGLFLLTKKLNIKVWIWLEPAPKQVPQLGIPGTMLPSRGSPKQNYPPRHLPAGKWPFALLFSTVYFAASCPKVQKFIPRRRVGGWVGQQK